MFKLGLKIQKLKIAPVLHIKKMAKSKMAAETKKGYGWEWRSFTHPPCFIGGHSPRRLVYLHLHINEII